MPLCLDQYADLCRWTYHWFCMFEFIYCRLPLTLSECVGWGGRAWCCMLLISHSHYFIFKWYEINLWRFLKRACNRPTNTAIIGAFIIASWGIDTFNQVCTFGCIKNATVTCDVSVSVWSLCSRVEEKQKLVTSINWFAVNGTATV